ncbi:hypothetical protein Taro_013455 [Colocasia esculenta]|uniref:Citrate synthase n=1 Tax=Colocasia esculenta TaxID=4460 RepID=A0A843U6L6_COLES|nr:hypothetical protein [Colocasia esculenta]
MTRSEGSSNPANERREDMLYTFCRYMGDLFTSPTPLEASPTSAARELATSRIIQKVARPRRAAYHLSEINPLTSCPSPYRHPLPPPSSSSRKQSSELFKLRRKFRSPKENSLSLLLLRPFPLRSVLISSRAAAWFPMGSVEAAASVRGRLAVLSAHLFAAVAAEYDAGSSTVLKQSPVSAQVGPPAPGNLGGRLTVIDGRTGKKYEVEVSQEGTITTGKDDKGIKLYDPGYLNTAPVRSSICYIDGDAGILRYRGYPIEELAENSTFLEVAYLLMYGNLPSQNQLADWEFAISQHSAVPQGVLDIIQAMPHDAHPMGVLVSAMSALSVFHPDANPALRGQSLYQSKQVRDKQIARILGKAPTIAAAAYLRLAGRPPVLPSSNLGDRAYKPNPRLARVLDILFILHAEHEMNCSTAAARHLASSGVDVYTALSGAVGALYGPLHGGANEAVLKMLNEIGTVESIPEFIEGVKNRKRKMSGFGHRVYKNYDPRAKVIRKLAEEVFSIVGRDPLIEVYTGVWLRPYIPVNERLVHAEADRLGQVSVSNATRRRLAGSGA